MKKGASNALPIREPPHSGKIRFTSGNADDTDVRCPSAERHTTAASPQLQHISL